MNFKIPRKRTAEESFGSTASRAGKTSCYDSSATNTAGIWTAWLFCCSEQYTFVCFQSMVIPDLDQVTQVLEKALPLIVFLNSIRHSNTQQCHQCIIKGNKSDILVFFFTQSGTSMNEY